LIAFLLFSSIFNLSNFTSILFQYNFVISCAFSTYFFHSHSEKKFLIKPVADSATIHAPKKNLTGLFDNSHQAAIQIQAAIQTCSPVIFHLSI